jgi:hypothetical protein
VTSRYEGETLHDRTHKSFNVRISEGNKTAQCMDSDWLWAELAAYTQLRAFLLWEKLAKIYVPCALTKHHAMKAYWGSGGIAPLIL